MTGCAQVHGDSSLQLRSLLTSTVWVELIGMWVVLVGVRSSSSSSQQGSNGGSSSVRPPHTPTAHSTLSQPLGCSVELAVVAARLPDLQPFTASASTSTVNLLAKAFLALTCVDAASSHGTGSAAERPHNWPQLLLHARLAAAMLQLALDSKQPEQPAASGLAASGSHSWLHHRYNPYLDTPVSRNARLVDCAVEAIGFGWRGSAAQAAAAAGAGAAAAQNTLGLPTQQQQRHGGDSKHAASGVAAACKHSVHLAAQLMQQLLAQWRSALQGHTQAGSSSCSSAAHAARSAAPSADNSSSSSRSSSMSHNLLQPPSLGQQATGPPTLAEEYLQPDLINIELSLGLRGDTLLLRLTRHPCAAAVFPSLLLQEALRPPTAEAVQPLAAGCAALEDLVRASIAAWQQGLLAAAVAPGAAVPVAEQAAAAQAAANNSSATSGAGPTGRAAVEPGTATSGARRRSMWHGCVVEHDDLGHVRVVGSLLDPQLWAHNNTGRPLTRTRPATLSS
jgi:hypothetical protein